MPVFSLPGKYGIGTLGQEAYRFIDLLCETGHKIWQILPMGPTGFGDSPYQSFSAFAGNPYFVDLEMLIEEGLLTAEELADPEAFDFGDAVDYPALGRAEAAAKIQKLQQEASVVTSTEKTTAKSAPAIWFKHDADVAFRDLRRWRKQPVNDDAADSMERVNYGKLYHSKTKALKLAYTRFKEQGGEVEALLAELRPETIEYCVFMAIKDSLSGASWDVWPEELRDCDPKAVEAFRAAHEDEVGFYAFVQYEFNKQWAALRAYAKLRGIEILGDIPIYCAPDSADAWAHRELFQYTKDGHPSKVAGVPPDAFSATGQLWGNPLYDWAAHKKTNYAWWCARMEYCLGMYDCLRVDHFRGFEAYYAVPFGDETAKNGTWVKGPGMGLFRAMYKHFGTKDLPIVAEDLGIITDEVRKLMTETGFPGMKVLQFAWDSGAGNAYLPHNFTTPNCVCYTGTHDNDTLRHWFETIPDWQRGYMYQYMSRSGNDWNAMPELLIKRAMGSIANTVIVPAADYLGLGAEGRVNQPGTSGNNWQWRMVEDAFTEHEKQVMVGILRTYDRFQEAPAAPVEDEEEKQKQ